MMRVLIGMALVAFGALAYAGTPDVLEDRKIQFLIAVVENLHDAQFVRNDVAYEAKAAADHLRLKLRGAGSRVASAEDFIRLCASVSSMSGRPYQIRFSDGRVVTSEEFLRQRLTEFVP
jgi:uncharacterized protein DUF5329